MKYAQIPIFHRAERKKGSLVPARFLRKKKGQPDFSGHPFVIGRDAVSWSSD
jgi:hypothetical protein